MPLAMFLTACGAPDAPDPAATEPVLPDVSGVTFVTGVDNVYLPLPAGATWSYVATTEEGEEDIAIAVLAEEKIVSDVSVVVVQDTATVDGAVTEDTRDWFAQDSDGNVWYVGEDTCEYEDGACANTEGSWEWGVDGALPGLVMPAEPTVDGQPYYQEFYEGHAEDVGEVVGVGVAIGDYTDCLETHETSTLETDASEYKWFCAGLGLVHVDSEDEVEELVTFSGLE